MPSSPATNDLPTVNLTVLRGVASGPPEVRTLASGSRVASIAVRVHSLGPGATSVPVAVWDPPAWIDTIDAGDPLVVVGALRRRFYRPGTGGVGARVEVDAQLVGRGTDRRRLATARRRTEEALDALS